jgi:hypothetical protein
MNQNSGCPLFSSGFFILCHARRDVKVLYGTTPRNRKPARNSCHAQFAEGLRKIVLWAVRVK